MADKKVTELDGLSSVEARTVSGFLAALDEATAEHGIEIDPYSGMLHLEGRFIGYLRWAEGSYRFVREA